jgi:hypothetical protein
MYGKMVGAGTGSRKLIETFLATPQNKARNIYPQK